MRLAILAVLVTSAAHAFTPTLFFNVTMDPLHGMLDYKDRTYKDPSLNSKERSNWTTTYTGTDMATFKPGDVGQGETLQHGVLNSYSVGMQTAMPFKSVYVYGTAPEGIDTSGASSILAPEVELSVKFGYTPFTTQNVNNSGDFILSREFDAMSNYTAELRASDPRNNRTGIPLEVVVKQVDVTLGIETTATSLESVPTRTELFNLNGGENPFFHYTTFAEANLTVPRGNFTFPSTEDPAQPAALAAFGSLKLSCKLPRNTSLMTVTAYTGPEAGDWGTTTFTLYPAPPFAYDSGNGWSERTHVTLYNSFTALVTAYTRILDPSVEYVIEIGHFGRDARNGDLWDRTLFQSITFYSSTDKAPEGGGPAPESDPIWDSIMTVTALPTASSAPWTGTILPSYTGE